MSQENVQIVRDGWKRWMSGNTAALSLFDPDVVYEDDLLPDNAGETYHGLKGLLRAWTAWTEPWEAFETDLEWARDAGDEVVSCHRAHLRGKGSGIDTEILYAYLWRFRAGKIIYCKVFGDPSQALEAAGLSE